MLLWILSNIRPRFPKPASEHSTIVSDISTFGSCTADDEELVIISSVPPNADPSPQVQAADVRLSFADQLKALDDELEALNLRGWDLIKAEKRRFDPLIDEMSAIQKELTVARARYKELKMKENELKKEYDKTMAQIDKESDKTAHRHHHHFYSETGLGDTHKGPSSEHVAIGPPQDGGGPRSDEGDISESWSTTAEYGGPSTLPTTAKHQKSSRTHGSSGNRASTTGSAPTINRAPLQMGRKKRTRNPARPETLWKHREGSHP